MKYMVNLIKIESYEVEANNQSEAFDKACELCDADSYAWSDPVIDYNVELMEEK